MPGSDSRGPRVLRNKRDATKYAILVEVAERQPAVNQGEIAEAVGVTSQAVSDYVRDLVERGYVEKHGRGRYEVTKEGVNWLIERTESLQGFLDRVSSEVLGHVEIDAAIATSTIEEGDTVSLTMRDGVLHATPGPGTATAIAVTDADPGEDIGVTDFEGMVEYDTGRVTVVAVPSVTDGGSRALEPSALVARADEADLIGVAGTEAYAAVARADLDPDVRFGTVDAVAEAALRGLDVLLVAATGAVTSHVTRFNDENLNHEVLDAEELTA